MVSKGLADTGIVRSGSKRTTTSVGKWKLISRSSCNRGSLRWTVSRIRSQTSDRTAKFEPYSGEWPSSRPIHRK
jgi:hypothetical protein